MKHSIQDVWRDLDHPGTVELSFRQRQRRLPDGTQDLNPAGPGDSESDVILPNPELTIPPGASIPFLCGSNRFATRPNILRQVPISQWIQDVPIPVSPLLYTDTFNLTNVPTYTMVKWLTTAPLNASQLTQAVLRPLRYQLPEPAEIDRMRFIYCRPALAINDPGANPPCQAGGIVVRFFDSFNQRIGSLIHTAEQVPPPSQQWGPTDSCTTDMEVILYPRVPILNVSRIQIHFHGRHRGLSEIEAEGVPDTISVQPPPPIPDIVPLNWRLTPLATAVLPPVTLPVAQFLPLSNTTDFLDVVRKTPDNYGNPGFGNPTGKLEVLTDGNPNTVLNMSNTGTPFYWTLPTARTITFLEVYAKAGATPTACKVYVNFYNASKVLIYRTPLGTPGEVLNGYALYDLLAGTTPFRVQNCKYVLIDTVDDGVDGWYNVRF